MCLRVKVNQLRMKNTHVKMGTTHFKRGFHSTTRAIQDDLYKFNALFFLAGLHSQRGRRREKKSHSQTTSAQSCTHTQLILQSGCSYRRGKSLFCQVWLTRECTEGDGEVCFGMMVDRERWGLVMSSYTADTSVRV